MNAYNGSLEEIVSAYYSNDINLPQGVYQVTKSITIPKSKRLVFSRGARIAPSKGVYVNLNCAILAEDDDYIFDTSLGGFFGGEPRIDKVSPHWFGAVGDGVSDDSKAFQYANNFCDRRLKLKLLGLTYRIRETVDITCRGIEGTAAYVDGSMRGTVLSFEPTKENDLDACLNIHSGTKAVFENFSVRGKKDYSVSRMADWLDRRDFDNSLYSMFATGSSAIRVISGGPVFRNIQTAAIKCGLLLDNSTGHVTSYDCGWSGMFGIYCLRSSGDYFLQGGSISGSFCGLLLGTKLEAGHRGGFGGMLNRVHMGFSPYGIYQCIEDIDDYNSVTDVGGLSGTYKAVQFEVCGEAAIKLLPKSITSNFANEGFGFSWSSDVQDGGAWKFAIPDSILPRGSKQKYAAYFGTIQAPVQFGTTLNKLKKSNALGALGSALVENITANNSSSDYNIDLAGLGESKYVVINKKAQNVYSTMGTDRIVNERSYATLNAVSPGNMISNPEDLNNWEVSNGGKIEMVGVKDVPYPISDEMIAMLGNSPSIIKLTPNGLVEPGLRIKFKEFPLYVGNRNIFMSYYVLTPTNDWLGGQYATAAVINVSRPVGEQVFNVGADYYKDYGWRRKVGIEGVASSGYLYDLAFTFKSVKEPTYFVGVTVSLDAMAAYSPTPHAYVNGDLGVRDDLILCDRASGLSYRIYIDGGKIAMSPVIK